MQRLGDATKSISSFVPVLLPTDLSDRMYPDTGPHVVHMQLRPHRQSAGYNRRHYSKQKTIPRALRMEAEENPRVY
jgi:hypothetical protein